jgi:alkyl hydroperoxide reductase subunit AhpF
VFLEVVIMTLTTNRAGTAGSRPEGYDVVVVGSGAAGACAVIPSNVAGNQRPEILSVVTL